MATWPGILHILRILLHVLIATCLFLTVRGDGGAARDDDLAVTTDGPSEAGAALDRRSVCLTGEASTDPGGFSNSVALSNSIMHSAALLGLGFAYKAIVPFGHNIRTEFTNVFQDKRRTSTATNVKIYTGLTCRRRDRVTQAELTLQDRGPTSSLDEGDDAASSHKSPSGHVCCCWAHNLSSKENALITVHSDEFITHASRFARFARRDPNTIQNVLHPDVPCALMVEIPAAQNVHQLHNYTVTGPYLRRDYHRADTSGRPFPPHVADIFSLPIVRPVRVALHHRLGDVANVAMRGETSMFDVVASKRMSATWPVFALVLLFRVINPDCATVFLLSEGHASDREINAIQHFFGPSAHIILEGSLPGPRQVVGLTRRAFDIMAHADILVAATSGFSRFAAVLSNKIRIAPDPVPSHPLSGISQDIVLVPKRDLFWSSETDGNDKAFLDLMHQAARAAQADKSLIATLRERLHASAAIPKSCFIVS